MNATKFIQDFRTDYSTLKEAKKGTSSLSIDLVLKQKKVSKNEKKSSSDLALTCNFKGLHNKLLFINMGSTFEQQIKKYDNLDASLLSFYNLPEIVELKKENKQKLKKMLKSSTVCTNTDSIMAVSRALGRQMTYSKKQITVVSGLSEAVIEDLKTKAQIKIIKNHAQFKLGDVHETNLEVLCSRYNTILSALEQKGLQIESLSYKTMQGVLKKRIF